MGLTRYYTGGFQAAATAQNKAEQWDDVAQTYTSWDTSGVVTLTRPYTAAEIAAGTAATAAQIASTNAATLRQRAQTALTNNQTFLAIASPTNVQAVTQVQALTRQMDSVIRLMQGLLDQITDS